MGCNVWDEAGILPMAIRLRKADRCPRDIDDLYGQIIVGIVRMASILLPQEDPRYECHRADFLTEEVQSNMVVQILTAAEKYVDTDQPPRSIVNYLVKATQNRLRNWVRDTENRKNRIDFVSESDLGFDISELGLKVCRLDGGFVDADVKGRVCTCELRD